MSDIIQINETLRVRDFDVNQYVVEYRTVTGAGSKNPNKEVWHGYKYCGTPASVLQNVSDYLGTEAANRARTAAISEFSVNPLCDTIMSLPKKPKKVKS